MASHEEFSDLDPTVQLVNSYDAIPQQDRKGVLDGLILASKHAPTSVEKFVSARRGGTAQESIDIRYRDLADTYAIFIDKNFEPGAPNNDPKIEQRRATFHQMINSLSAEQIGKGVTEIIRRAPKSTPPQE